MTKTENEQTGLLPRSRFEIKMEEATLRDSVGGVNLEQFFRAEALQDARAEAETEAGDEKPEKQERKSVATNESQSDKAKT